MKCDKIKLSLAELRRRFPFSKTNSRSPDKSIPDLKDVNLAVIKYQRPKDYFVSKAYLQTYQRADWHGAPAPLRLFVWRYMRALRSRGLPFYVHNCYRTISEQEQLYLEGRTQLKSGAHNRSAAVDIVSAIDHWHIPDDLWTYVGTLGEAISRDTHLGQGLDNKPLKIEWGGRWKFKDPAHFQLSDWRKRPLIVEDELHRPLRISPYSDQMRFG